MRRWLPLLVCVAACGRLGFDELTPGGGGSDGGTLDGGGGTDGAAVSCAPVTGTVVRPAETGGPAWSPSLAWTGDGFGVAWSDRRLGEYEIFLQRLAADGTPVDAERNVSSAPEHSWFPSLVWYGDGFALAWSDDQSGTNDVHFAWLPESGIERRLEISSGGDAWWPHIAWTGSHFVAVWADDVLGDYDVHGLQVELTDSGTTSMGRQLTSTGVTSWAPRLAWTGAGFGMVWEEPAGGDSQIAFALLDEDLALAGEAVPLTESAGSSSAPVAAWTGAGFGVAWYDGRHGGAAIYFRAVAPDGTPGGPEIRLTTGASAFRPSIAWSGDRFGLAWVDERHGRREIYFAELSATGDRIGDEVRLTDSPAEADNPSLVWTGTGFAVAWDQRTGGDESDEITFALVCP